MAKLDYEMAMAVFEQEHNRMPMVTELPMIRSTILATAMLASTADHVAMWDEFHNPPTPVEDVNWDEFSLMGCLDGGQG